MTMFQFGEDVVQLDPDNIEVAISRERRVISRDIFFVHPKACSVGIIQGRMIGHFP
jgi:hypothetical protein